MKKLFYFFGLLWCCAYLTPLYAQTDSSNCTIRPEFSWHRDSSNCRKVLFTNKSTPISPNVHFVWKFGDGTSSNDVNVSHTYQQDGVYTVCLVMESGNNCRKEICRQIEVRCQQPPPPPACNVQAKFEWRKDQAQWNKVWFANLSQPIQNIWRTSWSYGDGTTSQDFNSVHVYQKPGKYYVCLKVQSLNGCIKTYCDSVIVRPPVNCDTVKVKFEYIRHPEKPYVLHFRAISNVPIAQQTWTILKLSNTTIFPPPMPVLINANNPTYSFRDSGWYMVCLYAITNNLCKKTYCEKIYIAHGENGRIATSGGITAYPNPANNLVRLDVALESAALLQVRVLDGMGAPKMKFVSPGRTGNNNLVIPIEKLSSGFYVVEIRYGNQLKLVKFQKS